MAISFSKVNTDAKAFVVGDRVKVVTDVTLDASYPSGGYAISPSTFGLTSFDDVDVSNISPVAGAVSFIYNYQTGKLQSFANTGSETTGATDLHTCTGRISFTGKGNTSYAK